MLSEIFIKPTLCVNANQKVYEFCLPSRIECFKQPKNGRLIDCGSEWNCNLQCQTDRMYWIPYVKGDCIQFQTLFYSGTTSNPTPYDDIVTVTLCSEDNEEPVPFKRKMSAWKNKKPYQIIEIDTTDFPKCWQLKFETEDDECCTQHFKEYDCHQTILIQSKRESRDCFGYCYGIPDNHIGDLIEYNNSLRYCGFIKPIGCSDDIEKLEINGKISTEEIREVYKLGFSGKMPSFAKNILCNQLLTGDSICIDGVDYNSDGFNITNEIQSGSMWRFSIELYTRCFLGNNNCQI